MNASIECLKRLKSKLINQNMSVLIGAGLSKNVSHHFLSWNELLYDIAKTLFESEIENEFTLRRSLNKKEYPLHKYQEYLQVRLNDKIRSIGYVDMVSAYIKRRVIRESIETYIEERTPEIIVKGKEIYIKYKQDNISKERKLESSELDLHRSLIALPWNNIYTTNYDHLLEVSIDETIPSRIEDEINQLTHEIEEQAKRVKEKQTEKQTLLQKISGKRPVKLTQAPEALYVNQLLPDSRNSLLQGADKELYANADILRIDREILYANDAIKDKRLAIDKLQNNKKECLTVINHSSQLALKRTKNIIKLHGSLRNSNEAIGFDDDWHRHYVISKEDYDNYPRNHEAFTQLMRIALLQESFCVIGFSGDDPNFLAWVTWVRDIIKNYEASDDTQLEKIYMIAISSVPPTAEKALFYQNHRIKSIQLLEKEVIDFLREQTAINVSKDSPAKDVITALIKFLGDGLRIENPRVSAELLAKEQYNRSWQKMQTDFYSTKKIKNLTEIASRIQELKSIETIPNIGHANTHVKEEFLSYLPEAYNQLKTDQEKIDFFKLVAVAIRDLLVPYSTMIHKDDFERILNETPQIANSDDAILTQLKNTTWCHDLKNIGKFYTTPPLDKSASMQERMYFQALSAAFDLNFTKLQKILRNWQATGIWAVKKAGLNSYFDPEQSVKILESSKQNHLQDELHRLELKDYLQKSQHWKIDKELNEKLRSFESHGFKSIDFNADYLLKQINKIKNEIKPLGKNQLSINHTISFSNNSQELSSIQFIGLLIESGFPLSLGSINFRNHKEVFSALQTAMAYYPFPTLFYALQYNNEDFLRRIAQEYAYSEHITTEIPAIAGILKKAFADSSTPASFKKSIDIFLSELLIVLKPASWSDFYLKIWTINQKENSLFSQSEKQKNAFLEKGLSLVNKPSVINRVLIDCLDYLDTFNDDQIISYLYYLANNYWLEKYKKSIRSPALDQRIKRLIESLKSSDHNSIFALGNIAGILNKNDLRQIRVKLRKFDYSGITNVRAWSVILYFVDGEMEAISSVKRAIINSPGLWRSGIKGNQAEIFADFIPLHRLRSNKYRKGIVWSATERRQITAKLKTEFLKIKTFYVKRSITAYESLLEEMLYFLKEKSGNVALIKDVTDLVRQQREFHDIEEGLLSDSQTKIILALREISWNIYMKKKIGDNDQYILLILNKLLLKSEPGLSGCLYYLTAWMNDFADDKVVDKVMPLVLRTIETYKKAPPPEMEKPFLAEKLIRLSYVLFNKYPDNQVIREIIESRNNNRYQDLLFKLKDIPVKIF